MYFYLNCKIKKIFATETRLPYDTEQSPPNKSGPAACIYQVIRIKTSNKLSEIYFLKLCLLNKKPRLVSNQYSIKILPINRIVEIEKQKSKAIKHS